MSWSLIKSIQKDTDLRLVLPFGLSLRLGDVISVDKDGTFTLEGSAQSLLRMDPGVARLGDAQGVDLLRQSSDGTTYRFRAAGTASTLFENLPSAGAGIDIEFGSEQGWLLAVTGRSLNSLDELDRFRRPILDAYRWRAWKPDWALVTSIGIVKRMTLLAAESRNTKVALSLSGDVAAGAAAAVTLTAGASILAASEQIVQCIREEPMVAFCSAIRVRDTWWADPEIGTLKSRTAPVAGDAIAVAPEEFWEDVDALSR